MSKNLNIFVPITKVDAVKGIVYGVLAAEETDHSGEVFDYLGSKPFFEKWSDNASKATGGKSLGNLRAMHGNVAAGKFTSMGFNDDKKQIEVAAKVVDKNELEKALEGVYTGFSIGGKYVSRKKDGDVFRYVADPYEGSLVDLPCIPSATFEIIKADGMTLQKKFNPVGEVEVKARELAKASGTKDEDLDTEWREFEGEAIEALAKAADAPVVTDPPVVVTEPTNDEVVAKAKELAKVAGTEDKWLDHIEPARTALKAVAKPAPAAPGAAPAPKPAPVAKLAHGATPSDDGSEGQVWVHKRLPGKTFATKGEMRQGLVDLDAQEAADKISKGVKDQLAGVTGALNERENPIVKAAFDAYASRIGEEADEAIRVMSGLSKVEWDAAGAFALSQQGHPAVKALAGVHVILDDKGVAKEMPDATKAALKALVAATKEPAPKPPKTPAEKAAQTVDLSKATDKDSFALVVKDLDLDLEPIGYLERRKIIKSARELSAIDVLPKAWGIDAVAVVDLKKVAAGDLKKAASLYGVGSLIQLLAQIDSAEENLESPGYGYGTMVPKALCDRFGAVLVEFGDIVAEVLDAILAEMKTEEMGEATGNVMRAAGIMGDLAKFVADKPLAKAGARHSKLDQTRLNDAHDLLVDAGAQCDAKDDDASKATISTLKKALVARDDAFVKTMGEVSTLIKDVAERVKRIEAQPMPEGTTSYRVVEKGLEPPIVGGPESVGLTGDHKTNIEIFAEMSNLLVRAAHGNPHHDIPGYMRPRPY